MTKLGLPVPPGFTITTEACRAWLASGSEPDGLADQVTEHLAALEEAMGRRLGDAADPLLVSVRSGAAVSMPGMMETVLNVGMNDESVQGLATKSGNPRFAWDSYRRLLQMFGSTVLGIDADRFADALDELKDKRGVANDVDLDADDLEALVAHVQGHRPRRDRARLPAGAARAAGPRHPSRLRLLEHRAGQDLPPPGADRRRQRHRRQRLLDGVRQPRAGQRHGRLLHPRPGVAASRASTATTCPTPRARTSSRASATPCRSPTCSELDPEAYDELLAAMATLERHYKDLCDIEFTVEAGKLWMLQTRVGKRTAGAAFRIAVQLVDEGVIDLDEALQRVSGAQLAQLMFPQFDADAKRDLIATGMAASPGAAVGKAAFDSATAVKWAGARRGRHPGPAGDQPGRPRRHGGGSRCPDVPRRQDLARRGGRARHGPHRRRRRRGAAGRPAPAHRDDSRGAQLRRGRRHLDRRQHGRGLPR